MNDYLRESYYIRLGIIGRDVDELNVVACRLMLDIMPGLETSVVFQVLIYRCLSYKYGFLIFLKLDFYLTYAEKVCQSNGNLT